MSTRDDIPDPLPREWLPDSTVPPEEDVTYWEGRRQALMAEAEAVLAEYRRPRPSWSSWLEALASRWRPAAAGALAVAASAVLALALGGGRTPPAPNPGSVVLSAVVSEGEPAALWTAEGVEADPTLALLALEAGTQREGGDR